MQIIDVRLDSFRHTIETCWISSDSTTVLFTLLGSIANSQLRTVITSTLETGTLYPSSRQGDGITKGSRATTGMFRSDSILVLLQEAFIN